MNPRCRDSINGKYHAVSARAFSKSKYFFSAGVAGSDGEGISSNSIKEFIKEIVDSEDPKVAVQRPGHGGDA